jgi:hypothetical protein
VRADFLAGRGEESTPEETLMVIHRLVHPLVRECPPQLTRAGGPRRFGGGLNQKPCENSNLPGMLWVWDRNEELRRMVNWRCLPDERAGSTEPLSTVPPARDLDQGV